MKFTTIYLSIVGLIYSFSSLAWREVGHFSVCEIAYKSLTPSAKIKVDTILSGKSFAEQCTWPDMVRKSKEWKHTYDWHFINLEDNQNYLTAKNINPSGDVISAILKSKSELENPNLPLARKKSSLLFLGHFIGDVHQSLHIGRLSDLGGNRITASWFEDSHFDDIEHLRVEGVESCLGPYYTDEQTGECVVVNSRRSNINLHKIWDLLMIEKFINEKRIASNHQYPYKEYVKEINIVAEKDITSWQKSFVLDWAQESLCYRNWAYQVGNKRLDETYYKRHIANLNTQILKAGYRLGHTLNRIFDPIIRAKFQYLDIQEAELSTTMSAVLNGNEPSHELSQEQCAVGVYQSP